MGNIIDIKPIPKFEHSEMVSPSCANLCGDINPEALNAHMMHTSVNFLVKFPIHIWFNYLPHIYEPRLGPRQDSIQAAT